MKSRLLTLMLALVIGGIAVITVATYVKKVEDESIAGQETVTVLVATRSLPSGMTAEEILEANAFSTEDIPQRFVLPGALTSVDELEGTLADSITAGEQITTQRFESSEPDAFMADFPEGTEALTLPLEFVRGIAGHVEPGDYVNAYVTADGKKSTARFLRKVGLPSTVGVFDTKESGVTLLLVGQISVREISLTVNPDDPSATQTTTGNMTLAVTPREAALLIHAQEKAKLWFTRIASKDVVR